MCTVLYLKNCLSIHSPFLLSSNRWRFVLHGCIDGYSRLPVFLEINTNNSSSTVLAAFIKAVAAYGLPERVRSDKGGENVQVAEYMILHKGPRSFIAGRSVHNQR